MKQWRVCLGSFLAALVFACGGQAEGGDSDDPFARDPGSNGPTTAAPTAPPPAYRPTTAPPPAVSNAPPEQAGLSPQAAELRLVETMLSRYCGDCHGAAAVANGTVASFDSVEDIEQMVQSGLIVPLNAERSQLYTRTRNGDMPPPGIMPRPSQTEIRAFESFIDGDALFWRE
jgi:hypothetical protein